MQNLQVNIKVFLLFFGLPCVCSAQTLTVLDDAGEYRKAVQADSLQAMVDIRRFVPSAVYDLRYATKDNFTGKRLYKKTPQTFVRLAVAKALQGVAADLADSGFTLKIWDAYRPYDVTKKMWTLIGDERYVANPAKGSGHNRGLAVDLTLMKDGKEVAMGTGFDNFSDTAHHNFLLLPATVLSNRQLLKATMERHGFRALDTEWWHFSWPNDQSYPVLNLSFKQLGRQR